MTRDTAIRMSLDVTCVKDVQRDPGTTNLFDFLTGWRVDGPLPGEALLDALRENA